MATRILHQQSNEEYHADLALGSSYVKDWNNRSPRHAEYGEKTINPYIADEGTAAHLVFEGNPDKVVQAGETRRGQSWADALGKAQSIGGVALPRKAYESAIAAGISAYNHGFMRTLRDQAGYDGEWSWVETSIFTTHPKTGLEIKCKPDFYLSKRGLLVDLKTTVSASPRDFTRAIFKMGYDLQAAYYSLVCRIAGLNVADEFHFIAVEKTAPYVTQHFVLEGDVLSAAEQRVEQILLEIAHSRETGEFSTGWPEVSKINLSTRENVYGL